MHYLLNGVTSPCQDTLVEVKLHGGSGLQVLTRPSACHPLFPPNSEWDRPTAIKRFTSGIKACAVAGEALADHARPGAQKKWSVMAKVEKRVVLKNMLLRLLALYVPWSVTD